MLPPSPKDSPSDTSMLLADSQDNFLSSLPADHYQVHSSLGLDSFIDFSSSSGFSDEAEERGDSVGSFSNSGLQETWESLSQYPSNTLGLLGAPAPSSVEPAFAHHLQSYHDSYYHPSSQQVALYGLPYTSSTPYNSTVTSKSLPHIRVQTTLPVSSNATPSLDAHSPFKRSPTTALMTPTRSSAYVSSSPSSTGSVPPHTPQSALNASPYGTPYLHQPSNIPISPSSALTITPHVLDEHFCSPIQQANTQRVLEIAQQYPHPFGAELVPQPDYKPHTQSDRRRYVEQVELDPPVLFEMQNSNGLRVGLGIPIEDAVRDRFMYLVGRDDPMFEGRGPSVSIRINWPGYPPWSRQIPTRDFRSPPQPVTRAKLARNVGKAIQRFFQDMVGRPMEDESQARWRVGPGHIVAEDLMLVGLQHVSMGSWQAHVRLIRKH